MFFRQVNHSFRVFGIKYHGFFSFVKQRSIIFDVVFTILNKSSIVFGIAPKKSKIIKIIIFDVVPQYYI